MFETFQKGTDTDVVTTEEINKKRFVAYDGTHCGLGERAKGLSYLDAPAGEMVALQRTGPGLVECGGTITAPGVEITSDADGKAIEATMPEAGTPVEWADVYPVHGIASGDPDGYPKAAGDDMRIDLTLK